MKFVITLVALISLNSWAAPCGGAQVGFWTNPDGSRGGWVGKDAKVQAGVIISPSAEVCDSAQVKSGAQILGQARVGGRAVINTGAVIEGRAKVMGEAKVGGGGATTKVGGDATIEGTSSITGASNVFARAKVGGGARVHNSVICQASVIESISVTDSDYYCQTEDPEPPHPGEAGKKTLLGVDSDRDGVRDDVEIWINDFYSNTAEKDNYFMRMVMKQYAERYNLILRNKDDKEKIRAIYAEVFDTTNCHRNHKKHNLSELTEIMEATMAAGREKANLKAHFFNSPSRIFYEQQTTKFLHATALVGGKKTKSGCYFKEEK